MGLVMRTAFDVIERATAMKVLATDFDGQTIRRVSDEATQAWWFSVIDVVQVLTLPVADDKNYLTDCATAETLLRLVKSIPSPKAEPIKLWLVKVGYKPMQERADPALSLDRARQTWRQHGRSDKWIQQRMTGQETRNKLLPPWPGCPPAKSPRARTPSVWQRTKLLPRRLGALPGRRAISWRAKPESPWCRVRVNCQMHFKRQRKN